MIAVNECDSKHRGSKPRCHGSYKTQISFSVTLSAWLLVLNEHKAERLNCLLSHLEASHNIYIYSSPAKTGMNRTLNQIKGILTSALLI